MHRIRTHPPLLLFSRGLSQSKPWSSQFGSSAASFWEARGFALPASRRGCPSRSASLRKMRLLLVLLSASGESHASIISESQCLGYPYSPSCREELFSETELPASLILGNLVLSCV